LSAFELLKTKSQKGGAMYWRMGKTLLLHAADATSRDVP
jgi:hypothetical protein